MSPLLVGIIGIFVLILLILIGLSFWSLFKYGKSWGDAMDLIQQLLPAITALLGSAVGFYFGTRADQSGE